MGKAIPQKEKEIVCILGKVYYLSEWQGDNFQYYMLTIDT